MEEKYWQEVPEAQYPVLRGQQKCDVAIVGGGLVGVTLAWIYYPGREKELYGALYADP